MQEHHISVTKTARYYTLGDVSNAKHVWIVLHGYAELARDFIGHFTDLVNDETAVIAPEGLHRFYKRGFYGDVVASWMTKEDRLNDIQDYIGYLNTLVKQCSNAERVNIFGFSQGVATACRWLGQTTVKNLNAIVLWAGTFPTDVELNSAQSSLYHGRVYLCFDDQDPFRTNESWQKQLAFFEASSITPHLFPYIGKHEIPKHELKRFLAHLL